jgi:hypothetical protein
LSWCFVGDTRVHVRIEEHRTEPCQQLIDRFVCLGRERRTGACRRLCRCRQRRRRDLEDEFSRGEVVVRTGVEPEQFGVTLKLRQRCGIDALRMRQDGFEHAAHLEGIAMLLVVEDVTAGERSP